VQAARSLENAACTKDSSDFESRSNHIFVGLLMADAGLGLAGCQAPVDRRQRRKGHLLAAPALVAY
jgi:hypothetical protein